MENRDQATDSGAARPLQAPAYGTFPHVTTHGPRERRSFHRKPEDWKRLTVRRTFGGKVK